VHAPVILFHTFHIFFQANPALHDPLRMIPSDIAEVPRLEDNARDVLLVFGIAKDEAELVTVCSKPYARLFLGKRGQGTGEIVQVGAESALMFACAGNCDDRRGLGVGFFLGHVLVGRHAVVEVGLLLCVASVCTGYRHIVKAVCAQLDEHCFKRFFGIQAHLLCCTAVLSGIDHIHKVLGNIVGIKCALGVYEYQVLVAVSRIHVHFVFFKIGDKSEVGLIFVVYILTDRRDCLGCRNGIGRRECAGLRTEIHSRKEHDGKYHRADYEKHGKHKREQYQPRDHDFGGFWTSLNRSSVLLTRLVTVWLVIIVIHIIN